MNYVRFDVDAVLKSVLMRAGELSDDIGTRLNLLKYFKCNYNIMHSMDIPFYFILLYYKCQLLFVILYCLYRRDKKNEQMRKKWKNVSQYCPAWRLR
jgi:hypothetical protein